MVPLSSSAWSRQLDRPVDPAAVAAWWWSTREDVVWLDSSSGGTHLIGVGSRRLLVDSIDELKVLLAAESELVDDAPLVGWFSYESGTDLLPLPPAPRGRFVGVALLALDQWVVIDDQGHTTLHARTPELAWSLPEQLPTPLATGKSVITQQRDHDEHYAELIEACLEHLKAGEASVLCLTTALEAPPIDAFASHLRLRELSPVPYAGLLRIAGTTLSSASMEQFLQVQGRAVVTSPIKGTRRRLSDPQADAALAEQLRSSSKERAENQTVTNQCVADLGRVCVPDSVAVDELLQVRSYATVHQLVSSISGQLSDDVTALDALAALFPAASMTGAPKTRAVEIVGELERHPRGIYSGCFGVLSGADVDLAMVIRSVVSDAEGAHLGVGGGITAQSDVAAEVAEVHLKSGALRQCLIAAGAR